MLSHHQFCWQELSFPRLLGYGATMQLRKQEHNRVCVVSDLSPLLVCHVAKTSKLGDPVGRPLDGLNLSNLHCTPLEMERSPQKMKIRPNYQRPYSMKRSLLHSSWSFLRSTIRSFPGSSSVEEEEQEDEGR